MPDNQNLGAVVEHVISNISRAATLAIVGLLAWALASLQSLSVETAVIKAQLAEIQRRIDRQEAHPCACNQER